MTVNLEKLSQYVKSGQCVLKQHENDSKKTKSKYCETFRDIIDYGYNILYSILCYYRAMHFSAKRGIAIACRLSVCPSVRLSVNW